METRTGSGKVQVSGTEAQDLPQREPEKDLGRHAGRRRESEPVMPR